MTFISLPCCFGEPLGDVTLWMQICGNYRYLTTRYDYPPKRAMFFRAFPFFIWLLIMLLENLQSYDENLCCLFIPKYIFAYLLMREHLAPFQNTAFYDTIIKHNFNFYHRSCGTGKNIIWSNACCSKEEWQVTAKVSKLFSKLVFPIDFSAFAVCVGFFSTEILLIAWDLDFSYLVT